MKLKTILLPMLAGGSLILPSWGDPAAQLIQAEAKEAPAEAGAMVVPAGLAQKLGFAAHVPKSTEGYLSVMGGYDMYQRLLKTELGKLIAETMADQGANLEEMEEEEEVAMLKAIVGEEIFAAFGDSAGKQALHLQTLNNSSSFHQMKMLVKIAEMAIDQEADPSQMQGLAMGMFSSVLGDPEAGLAVFEKAEMPPVTIGFKVSDKDMRVQISETMIGGVLSLFDQDEDAPFVEIEMERDGVAFSGMTIVGKKLAAMADEDTRQQMTEVFGNRANVDRMMTALEKKNFNIAIGVKDEYIMVHLGGSLDGLKIPTEPEDSLLANKGMDFLENYGEKDVRILLFGEGEALKSIAGSNEVLGSMMKGLKAGLAEAEVFGDTRDIQALLGHVAKVEGKIFDMFEYGRTGMVGFIEEGFKLETHAAGNLPTLDNETAHTFAGLGDMEDVVFFSNSRSNPDFTSKMHEMMDSLGEAAYLMASRVSEMDIDDDDFRQFREGFKMFDEMGAGDLKGIWGALSTDWAQGTGNEGAIIIDTKGTMPKVPEVPGAIIEKGLIPRIAYVTPMTDRAKMTSAWTKIEKSIVNILKTVKEMEGPEIPMQEIDDNTKDGVTYYSTAIQFSTKDARPVVGMTDTHFYFSTSQKFIAELSAKVGSGDVPVRKGSYTRINLAAARGLAEDWVNLLKESADEVFTNEYQLDDFNENLPLVKKFLKGFEQLEEITTHTRMEGDEARTSVHVKMK